MPRIAGFLSVIFAIFLLAAAPAAGAGRLEIVVLSFTGEATTSYHNQATEALRKMLGRMERFDIRVPAPAPLWPPASGWKRTSIMEAMQIGQQLGAAIVFAGDIETLHAWWVDAEKNEKGKDYKDKGHYAAECRISVQIVAVQTGQVLSEITSSGSATDARSRSAAQEQALAHCFDTDLLVKLREIFAINSDVAAVDGRTVHFALSDGADVRAGTRFHVIRLAQAAPGAEAPVTIRRRVGLIETSKVTASAGEGYVLWSEGPVLPGDHLQEEARSDKRNGGIGFTVMRYYLEDQSGIPQEGVTVAIGGYGGQERPYCCHWGFLFEIPAVLVSELSAPLLVNTGVYFGGEKEVKPGHMYTTGQVAAGITIATQPYANAPRLVYSSGTATANTFFLAALAGVKYYFFREEGLRLELGIGGQWEPSIRKWSFTDGAGHDRNVTDYVRYPVVNLSGLRLRTGFSVSF